MESYYRLCRVVGTEVSEGDGVVRTVRVAIRDRRTPLHKSSPPRELTVGVQRLVLILPREEQGEHIGQDQASSAIPQEEVTGGKEGGVGE